MARRERDEDPIEQMRRKFRVLCKFRMLGRLVVENLAWMLEEVELNTEMKSLTERAQNILAKKKLLTIQDKYLLIKNHKWRTDEENYHVYKILGNLKCFWLYPKNVIRKLSTVCYFKFYGPGRVIVKKGHKPNAMYYVVSGEIELIDKIFDPYEKTWLDGFAGLIQPGMDFGQEDLLHNFERKFTYKSLSNVELICIHKEDFDEVIEVSIKNYWNDVKRAFSRFTYFDTFSEEAILQGCMLSKVKSYKVNEILLGDGKGFDKYVYFILNGTCQFIDTLFIKEKKYTGNNIVYTDYTAKIQISTDEDASTQVAYKTTTTDSIEEQVVRESKLISGESFLQLDNLRFDDQVSLNPSSISSVSSRKYISSGAQSLSVLKLCHLPKNVNIHFMQVCLMNAGGCFGWEDKLEYRRIVALTDVKCLLLPKYWLWRWNPFNIWHRVKHHYDRKIPSREKIFDQFVVNRKWDKYKTELIADVIRDKKAVNWTRRQDVPYTINIKENLNLRKEYNMES